MFDKMLGGFSMSILTAASSKSAWRGYEYFIEDKVQFIKKLDGTHFVGAVTGSEAEPYAVTIDIEHSKRSTCDCPFANGLKVCKHMVAVYFAAFPEEAIKFKSAIDRALEDEERYREELPGRIEKYINKLNKAQLKDLALNLIYELPEYEFERFVGDYID